MASLMGRVQRDSVTPSMKVSIDGLLHHTDLACRGAVFLLGNRPPFLPWACPGGKETVALVDYGLRDGRGSRGIDNPRIFQTRAGIYPVPSTQEMPDVL